MASITTDKDGNRMIQFVGKTLNPETGRAKRHSIRLGKRPLSKVEAIKDRIELLVLYAGGESPDKDTAAWLQRQPDDIYGVLAAAGLVESRTPPEPAVEPTDGPAAIPLKSFLDDYVARRTDVKGSTSTVYNHTRRCLIEKFGAKRPLDSITVGEANDWRRWLTTPKNDANPTAGGQGLSENTARRRCGIAKQFFNDAIDRELVARNPFRKMKKLSVGANKERDAYIDRETADKIIAACPNAEWKLLFVLSRFGGLRCPSEHLALTWGDVNWSDEKPDDATVTVHSPKTEHHDGKGERVIPLWHELRPHLEAVRDELLADFDPKKEKLSEQPIIRHYRDSNANLRTQFCRILKRAGIVRWPKLFHNLRSTRETELMAVYDIRLVCAWIGNSPEVALKHYAQVRAEDRQQALMQNAMQSENKANPQPSEPKRNQTNEETLDCMQGRELSVVDSGCTSLRPIAFENVGDEGLEPPTFAV
jgi:integrase